jgi:hypothetical protein
MAFERKQWPGCSHGPSLRYNESGGPLMKKEVVPPGSALRFLGFFEGKTGVAPPQGWACELVENFAWWAARRHPGGRQLQEKTWVVTPSPELLTRVQPIEPRLLTDTHTTMDASGEEVRIERGQKRTAVRLEDFKRMGGGLAMFCRITVDDEKWFLAFFSDAWRPFLLTMVDGRSGAVQWRSKAWAGGEIEGPQIWEGTVSTRICVVPAGDQVYVFGCYGLSCYVEAFSVRTGKPVFQFSTGYCGRPIAAQRPKWEDANASGPRASPDSSRTRTGQTIR